MPSASDRPPAVWVDDLWVSFRVTREKNQTLKGTVARLRDRSKQSMLIEALRGVSFQVPGRLGLRRDRPQRRGQVDDAAHDRRHPAAHRGAGRGVGPGHAAAVAGCRVSTASSPAARTSCSAGSPPGSPSAEVYANFDAGRGVRGARRRDRLPDAHVLVGHVRPPRVLGRRAPASPRSCSSTRRCRRATPRSSRSRWTRSASCASTRTARC